jgi:predicted DNA-binding protein (UPF0251 family)
MARPCKQRCVSSSPVANLFYAERFPISRDTVTLSADEFEAIRLSDLEGCEQGESAVAMNISRQTYGRILLKAHAKVADALIHGKALAIGGGDVVHTRRRQIRCRRCRKDWRVPHTMADSFRCPCCRLRNSTK